MHWYFVSSSAYPDFVQWPVMCCCTCFHYKQSCRQVSAGSSHRCRWARQSGRTHVSTAGCHCRQWKCPPCLAPVLGWSPSGFGSSPPAGGSCADGYCGGHFLTVHSYRNTHQRQETNIKSYLVPSAICGGFVKLLSEEVDAVTWVKVRKLSYQFLRTSVVIKAAITIMRDTVIVIIWWTAKPAKKADVNKSRALPKCVCCSQQTATHFTSTLSLQGNEGSTLKTYQDDGPGQFCTSVSIDDTVIYCFLEFKSNMNYYTMVQPTRSKISH